MNGKNLNPKHECENCGAEKICGMTLVSRSGSVLFFCDLACLAQWAQSFVDSGVIDFTPAKEG